MDFQIINEYKKHELLKNHTHSTHLIEICGIYPHFFVHTSPLSRLNRLTYNLEIWYVG